MNQTDQILCDHLNEEATTRLLCDFFLSEGATPIGARIMVHLMRNETSCSFRDLETALCVSRGSISTNLHALEKLGFVSRRLAPGARKREEYSYADDLGAVLYRKHLQAAQENLRIMTLILEKGPATVVNPLSSLLQGQAELFSRLKVEA